MVDISTETSFNEAVKALETQFFPEDSNLKEENADNQSDSHGESSETEETEEENQEVEESEEQEEEEKTSEDLFELNVDGKLVKVPLDELKNGYLRQSSYTKKTTELAEQRKQVEALQTARDTELQQLTQVKTAYVNKLLEAEKALEPDNNIDWKRLADENPDLFVKLKYEDEIRQKALNAAREVREKTQKELAQQQETQFEAYLAKEHDLLKQKAPEFGDATQAPKLWEELNKCFVDEGFTREEVKALLNHKALLLVRDGIKYRNLQKQAETVKEKKVSTASKPLKSGTGNGAEREKSQTYRAAYDKARKTGNLRDVAALFE